MSESGKLTHLTDVAGVWKPCETHVGARGSAVRGVGGAQTAGMLGRGTNMQKGGANPHREAASAPAAGRC